MGCCFSHFSCGCWSCSDKGPTPLRNEKEICYRNSLFQALASSNKLIGQYKHLAANKTSDSKIGMLVDILNGINQSRDKETNSDRLNKLINAVQWNQQSQQDAFQMLSFVINNIEKDFGDFFDKEKKTMPPKFVMLHEFTENRSFNKLQDHLAIAVPLKEKSGVYIEHLLGAFFEESVIDDGPHKTSMSIYGDAPDVMILHIQANEWSEEHRRYIKPVYQIIYGDILKYNFKIQRKIDGSEPTRVVVEYRLMAVVQHMGDVGSGHYVTYRMHGDKWYRTNDEQVEQVKFKCDVQPYLMVYERNNERR